jgi:hypothetical protein
VASAQFRDVEAVNLETGAGNDLLILHGGTASYDGGGGHNAFYANFSRSTQAMMTGDADASSFSPGGVWTAGAAMGLALVRRLEAQAGVGLEVLGGAGLTVADQSPPRPTASRAGVVRSRPPPPESAPRNPPPESAPGIRTRNPIPGSAPGIRAPVPPPATSAPSLGLERCGQRAIGGAKFEPRALDA